MRGRVRLTCYCHFQQKKTHPTHPVSGANSSSKYIFRRRLPSISTSTALQIITLFLKEKYFQVQDHFEAKALPEKSKNVTRKRRQMAKKEFLGKNLFIVPVVFSMKEYSASSESKLPDRCSQSEVMMFRSFL